MELWTIPHKLVSLLRPAFLLRATKDNFPNSTTVAWISDNRSHLQFSNRNDNFKSSGFGLCSNRLPGNIQQCCYQPSTAQNLGSFMLLRYSEYRTITIS